jgi:hypothetical protein
MTYQLLDEVPICFQLAFLNLLFYHFLPLLSINLLILFRIFHTIAENLKEVPLTVFTPLESRAARSGDDGCFFFQRTRGLMPRVSLPVRN